MKDLCSYDLLGPNMCKFDVLTALIIILMLQADDIMTFFILHCCHHYSLNQHFIVQIQNLMKLLIFRWLYHHHWMVQHMTFMTFFLLNLQKSKGAL